MKEQLNTLVEQQKQILQLQKDVALFESQVKSKVTEAQQEEARSQYFLDVRLGEYSGGLRIPTERRRRSIMKEWENNAFICKAKELREEVAILQKNADDSSAKAIQLEYSLLEGITSFLTKLDLNYPDHLELFIEKVALENIQKFLVKIQSSKPELYKKFEVFVDSAGIFTLDSKTQIALSALAQLTRKSSFSFKQINFCIDIVPNLSALIDLAKHVNTFVFAVTPSANMVQRVAEAISHAGRNCVVKKVVVKGIILENNLELDELINSIEELALEEIKILPSFIDVLSRLKFPKKLSFQNIFFSDVDNIEADFERALGQLLKSKGNPQSLIFEGTEIKRCYKNVHLLIEQFKTAPEAVDLGCLNSANLDLAVLKKHVPSLGNALEAELGELISHFLGEVSKNSSEATKVVCANVLKNLPAAERLSNAEKLLQKQIFDIDYSSVNDSAFNKKLRLDIYKEVESNPVVKLRDTDQKEIVNRYQFIKEQFALLQPMPQNPANTQQVLQGPTSVSAQVTYESSVAKIKEAIEALKAYLMVTSLKLEEELGQIIDALVPRTSVISSATQQQLCFDIMANEADKTKKEEMAKRLVSNNIVEQAYDKLCLSQDFYNFLSFCRASVYFNNALPTHSNPQLLKLTLNSMADFLEKLKNTPSYKPQYDLQNENLNFCVLKLFKKLIEKDPAYAIQFAKNNTSLENKINEAYDAYATKLLIAAQTPDAIKCEDFSLYLNQIKGLLSEVASDPGLETVRLNCYRALIDLANKIVAGNSAEREINAAIDLLKKVPLGNLYSSQVDAVLTSLFQKQMARLKEKFPNEYCIINLDKQVQAAGSLGIIAQEIKEHFTDLGLISKLNMSGKLKEALEKIAVKISTSRPAVVASAPEYGKPAISREDHPPSAPPEETISTATSTSTTSSNTASNNRVAAEIEVLIQKFETLGGKVLDIASEFRDPYSLEVMTDPIRFVIVGADPQESDYSHLAYDRSTAKDPNRYQALSQDLKCEINNRSIIVSDREMREKIKNALNAEITVLQREQEKKQIPQQPTPTPQPLKGGEEASRNRISSQALRETWENRMPGSQEKPLEFPSVPKDAPSLKEKAEVSEEIAPLNSG